MAAERHGAAAADHCAGDRHHRSRSADRQCLQRPSSRFALLGSGGPGARALRRHASAHDGRSRSARDEAAQCRQGQGAHRDPARRAREMIPRISLRGISKRYPSVVANDDVSLDVLPGEILAILGENGAGKSTLMKIIYGVAQADAGSIAIDGSAVEIESPAQARSLGIAMVFQHFALFDSLTVAENVALGLPPARLADVEARLAQRSRRYALEIEL